MANNYRWEEAGVAATVFGAVVGFWPSIRSFLTRRGLRPETDATMKLYEKNITALQLEATLKDTDNARLVALINSHDSTSAATITELRTRVDSLLGQVKNLNDQNLQVQDIGFLVDAMENLRIFLQGDKSNGKPGIEDRLILRLSTRGVVGGVPQSDGSDPSHH